MYDAVSPYALLCLSRPKQPATVVTSYDLYSQAAYQPEHAANQAVPSAASVQAQTAMPAFMPPVPIRTHYISDIHARHGAAGKHALFNHEPLR